MSKRSILPVGSEPEDRFGPLPPSPVHRISTDADAIAIAGTLASKFKQGAAARDRDRLLPWKEIEDYTSSGLGAITIPKSHGGAGVSYETLVKVFEIICAADPALGQIPQNQFGVLALVQDIATPQQRERIYGDILAGYRIGNAGPERKTKAVNITTTRLEQTADGLTLSGQRFYSTGSIFAHYIPTRALDDEGRPVQAWASFDSPGLTVFDDWNSFGQRTTASGSVQFDAVPIDPLLVLPVHAFAEKPGLAGPVSQLIQAAIDAGIAKAAFQDMLSFVQGNARPWVDSGLENASDDPTILHEVGALAASLHAAQEVLYSAGRTIDKIAVEPVTAESSALASVAVAEAKILTTEIALEATEKLFDLSGSSATRAKHGLDRHWRNARVHTLHDPVRWKYHLIGNYELNGALPTRHQWN
ncbi:SfnB family sulfur acquisition oxidoreductase [Agrobacterium sp. Ap1]|jgi:SfnB family sulfur acquisition oxidoreductase|uniref:SfnB family sulfur acquisition oxidoreductase n=1 Tax=Agrobacterium sp. Ap1 TaxID=2815337 RepID=UPI001A8F5FC3|nr:SfnB family sulfur acquisition oxidoreductase [Agrobacterium sp. Ap1]MBO0145035.1 SfnB family sulfur acquisition oxidoreductase [Agrobacterium sp. Ap1]